MLTAVTCCFGPAAAAAAVAGRPPETSSWSALGVRASPSISTWADSELRWALTSLFERPTDEHARTTGRQIDKKPRRQRGPRRRSDCRHRTARHGAPSGPSPFFAMGPRGIETWIVG